MKLSPSLIGILCMVVGMAMMAVRDGFGKWTLSYITPLQLMWIHLTFAFLVMFVLTVRRHGLAAFKPTPFWPQFMRGVSLFVGVGFYYWTITIIPIADATAMALTAPLIVTALSPFLLGEKLGVRRVLAVLVGFIGVLLILRPGFRGDLEGYLLGATTGLLFGLNYIGNRMVASKHPPMVNYAHAVLFGAIMLAPAMPFFWQTLPETQYQNLGGFLVFALLGHGIMINAFVYGEASVIAPYQYSAIVFASIIGYVVFGSFPDAMTWAGISLIVSAGVFIAIRERQVKAINRTA